MYTTKAQICIRRDTAANFTSANPTLALGEIAYETDTRNIKVGNGSSAWTALPYINPFRGGTAAAPTSNTVLGSGAGAALQSGAELNTCIGANSGNALTSADFNVFVGAQTGVTATTGSQNVAVGYAAYQVGNGSSNTAVGMLSMLNNTTGGANTALGSGTSQTHTGANNTTAVGYLALNLNTASDITAVGANALDANTTGVRLVAVGSNALGANTGSDNTAVGHDALAANQAGSGNTAVGSRALDALATNTTDNVAVGSGALGALTDGSTNVAVGAGAASALNVSGTPQNGVTAVGGYALLSTTNAPSTTAVGTSAGRFTATGANCTSASNSVFIGANSRPLDNGQDNQVVIAGSVGGVGGIGNGSNTTTIGNSSTTGTFIPAGNLTVGSSATPTGALTINATSNAPGGSWNGGTDLLTLRTPTEYYGEPSIAFQTANNIGSKIGCKNVNFGAHDILFATRENTSGSTALTERMRIMHNGRVGIGTGAPSEFVHINGGNLRVQSGNVVLTSGNGIDFSATANSSGTMTSELLSDYEEGTWTPVYGTTGTGFTTMTMDPGTGTATYTKVGRQVTVRAWLQTDNVDATGATGNLVITGLPFTVSSTSWSAGAVGYCRAWAGNFPSNVLADQGSTRLYIESRATSNGATALAVPADLTAGVTADQNGLMFTCTYFV